MADHRRVSRAPGRQLGGHPGEVRPGPGQEVRVACLQDLLDGGADGDSVRAGGEQAPVLERGEEGGAVVAGLGAADDRAVADQQVRGGGDGPEEDADDLLQFGGAGEVDPHHR